MMTIFTNTCSQSVSKAFFYFTKEFWSLIRAVWFLIAVFSSSRVPDFSFYKFCIKVTPQEEITHRQVGWAQDHGIVISLTSPHLLLWVEQKTVFEKDKKCAFEKMAVIWVI